jgi:hypothetical protein
MLPIPEQDSDSLLSLYNKKNPDKNLFNLIDEENIRLSGSKLFIYKYYPSEEFDEVYMESRSKAVNSDPIIVFGHYEPREIEENLNEFGLDLQNDQIFTFNKSYIERKLGRPLISGDVIKPAFQEVKFKVFEVQESSFEVYGVYHLLCHAKILKESDAIQDQPLTDTTDELGGDFKHG